jgi:hypothetical protein
MLLNVVVSYVWKDYYIGHVQSTPKTLHSNHVLQSCSYKKLVETWSHIFVFGVIKDIAK